MDQMNNPQNKKQKKGQVLPPSPPTFQGYFDVAFIFF